MKKILLLTLSLICVLVTHAQITVSTNHINDNGNGSVTFNVENTNTYDIILTGINCHLGTTANNNVQLLYRTTPFVDNAAPWDFGTVGDGQNGWISAGTGSLASDVLNGVVPALANLNLIIPAGSTYQLGFSASTLQYMSLTAGAGINTFSAGGVDLLTGDGISWGGTPYPSTPSFYPRGFIGGISFIPAISCTGAPVVGLASASVSSACPSSSFNLTLPNAVITTGLTYQWQSAPSATGPWTDILSGTGSSLVTSQSVATWYQCVVTCTSAGLSTTSGAVQVGVNPFMDCYCTSIPTSAIDEEIYNVNINGGTTDPAYSGVNGCAGAAPGPGSILGRYSNFKTLPAITNVTAGQTVTFSIDQDECDGPTYYSNGIGMWIDFNQNGSFTDQDEAVFIEQLTAIGPRTVTGSFTVPITAVAGNTVVRVIAAENYSGSLLQPCMTYGYGETEDYLINIINATPCSGTPDAGTAISSLATACPTESFMLSLDSATIASGITYQWVSSTALSGPWTALAGATSSTFNTTISEDTYFACILTCTNSAAIDTSSTVLVLSTPFLNCYCTSEATNPADEEIFNVTLAGIDNSSDCSTTGGLGSILNMYSDYTADVAPAQLVQTTDYPISVEIGTCSGNWGNWTKVWIDYNQNGSFSDAGEEVYSSAASTVGAHFENGIVSIPLSATTGLTRMRVKVVEFETAGMTPCGNYTWGETEDYFVNILPAPNCANPTNIVANTEIDSILTTWSWNQTILPSTGFNMQLVSMGSAFNTGTTYVLDNNFSDTLFDSEFMAGQSFQMYLQAVCGQDTSYFIGPFDVVMPLSNDTICGAQMLPVNNVMHVFNNTGATIDANEIAIVPPATGAQTETGWENQSLNLTTWFKFVAPPSGSVRVNCTGITYNGQAAVYGSSACDNIASFQMMAANDNDMIGTSVAPNFSVCGLTPGSEYYIMHDAFNGTSGNYGIAIKEIVLDAGVQGEVLEVCYGDTVNLFNGIANYDLGGVWTQTIPTLGLQGNLFITNGLASIPFTFTYTLTDGCANDASTAQVDVFSPSQAGEDGAFTVCLNEPFNLLQGLGGIVDIGGTWYDPSNAALAGNLDTSSNIPGFFNYDYIAGNGVCPDDTSNVLVTVNGACDYTASIGDLSGAFDMYPNPTSDVLNIVNEMDFMIESIQVLDMQGKVVMNMAKGSFANNAIELSMKALQTGVYMVRLNGTEKTITNRVVKQ